MKKKAKVKTFFVFRVNYVDSANHVCGPDIISENWITLSASSKSFARLMPSIVSWHFRIEESAGELISLAKGEKCCKSSIGRIRSYSGCVVLIEVDSLPVFQMHRQMLDRWMAIMHRETENSPKCLVGANVATELILSDFITTMLYRGHVTALVDVLADVLYGFYRITIFDVQV